MLRYLFLLPLFLPVWSHAAVTLSEVAWMGSSDSANHEWIELHNDGSTAVDVTGWTLTDTTSLSIELAGSIAAGDYVVLERTSEASAPGSAFLIYTGALVNTGTTLSLRRADDGLEDQVAGGSDWENIGGDNTTKETAQYTTSGWQTAPGTPGAANQISANTASDNDDIDTATSNTSSNSPKNTTLKKTGSSQTVSLTLPPNSLHLTVTAPSEVFVRQTAEFSATPSGVGDTIANSTSYTWNFGDGKTAKGREVTHHYEFPGTYLVTVYGNYKRQEYLARHEITVLPVTLSVTRNEVGDLQLHNDAPYEMDISGYQIIGAKEFQFADNSFILPRQTITLSAAQIGGSARVHDSLGALVLREGAELAVATVNPIVSSQSIITTPIARASTAAQPQEPVTETDDPEVLSQATTAPMLIEISRSEASLDQDRGYSNTFRWPYLGLASLILIGWLSLLYSG